MPFLAAPPGFHGLAPDKPVTLYTRHLPHWRQDGATYFVTFRLADSLPQSKVLELRRMRDAWKSEHGIGSDRKVDWRSLPSKVRAEWEDLTRLTIQRVETWLDQGMGCCCLRQSDIAAILVEALHFSDGVGYEIGAYVVMPNHVHAIIRPEGDEKLESVLRSRKRRTAKLINSVLERTGTLWQEESFDRIVRDSEHLWRCVQYIGRNPKKSGIGVDECPRWIRPEWRQLAWCFDDESK